MFERNTLVCCTGSDHGSELPVATVPERRSSPRGWPVSWMLRCRISPRSTARPLFSIHNGITVTTHLLLAEQRTPGEPMRPFPLRMPSSQLARLNAYAERLRCYPAALARALVCRGLDQIESEVG